LIWPHSFVLHLFTDIHSSQIFNFSQKLLPLFPTLHCACLYCAFLRVYGLSLQGFVALNKIKSTCLKGEMFGTSFASFLAAFSMPQVEHANISDLCKDLFGSLPLMCRILYLHIFLRLSDCVTNFTFLYLLLAPYMKGNASSHT
jgi:hypothetical protein